MATEPLKPADIVVEEQPKLAEAMDWLIGFVNRELKAGSLMLVLGEEWTVRFNYTDLVTNYRFLYYWREHYIQIAAIFREQGWEVTEYPSNYAQRADEEQPMLGFKAVKHE